ncbi:uncharacterized protein M6B38_371380 [Iris pallida]|uniref:POPLD domain-containing protein n=1 Tax=Iris pallida TaxID=29817 RepID=A0AAX6GEA5_IRIPA|nr:uncharacterized protein M6B38_371380 [Iris pallida]
MVLLPFPSGDSGDMSNSVKYGTCFQNSMLYHVGTPFSQFISPVMYMWRPLLNENNNVHAMVDHVSNGYSTSSGSECRISSRQLWIWIHAAALKEGISALKHACQKQMQESGLSVSCNSLEGRIARLEVTGSTAVQILQKILHPVSEAGSTNLVPSRCSYLTACSKSQHQKHFFLEHAEHLPSNAILSLTVSDPRDLSSNGTKTISETTARSEAHFQEIDMQASNAFISGISTEVQDGIHLPWSEPEVNGSFLADNRYLWDFTEKLNPPVPENILCTEKHQRRLKYFYLDPPGDDKQPPKKAEGCGQSCPILLLKHANQGHFNNRWFIVLPLSWVKAFWIPLVSRGAHAIGLRERRWIASDSGLPTFPFDFPDCMAYSTLMAAEATAAKNSAELRPLAVRPSIVPIPPPWDCILCTLRNELNEKGNIQTLNLQPLVSEGIPMVSEIQNSESFMSAQGCGSFSGFIPRTVDALTKYLKNFLSGNVNQRPAESELCLERVLLHAYKEGFFEEGAIVCAPTLTDVLQWDSSSVEHENIQIPQSLIKTYFTQQESGKWELQLPGKCSSLESYRWPIGFLTTGFVCGSKKPVAVAFCETKLLTQLREQQSSQLRREQGRREIFLLVRNMRSAAYRRAVATIVLEQKNEDTEFM